MEHFSSSRKMKVNKKREWGIRIKGKGAVGHVLEGKGGKIERRMKCVGSWREKGERNDG